MGRLKHEFWKYFPLFICFYFINYLLNIFMFKYHPIDAFSENILLTTIMILWFAYINYSQNNHKNRGIYFSSNEIVVYHYKKQSSPWTRVKAERILKMSNFFHLIRLTFLDSGFSIKVLLFWPSIKSITKNTKLYVPKTHDFYKLVNEFNNKNVS